MRTELLGQEKNVVRVKVEFEAAEFMANLNEVVRDITQKANIPGFRKGRIPRKIIEMRFGKDNINKEALEKMFPEALKQVTEDYDLEIMDTPSLKIDDIHEGEPVTCELIIEVRPEIELPELEDIEVERLRLEVTDETLDVMTAGFRKQLATLNPVDRAATETDVVSATFVTRILNSDGVEAQVSEPYPSSVDLEEPSVRAEVRDALLGKSKGEESCVEFDVERDYVDASLAGRRVRYNITVNEINEKILPDVEPEFFKKVMKIDIATEADFRQEMKKRLHEHQEREETERAGEEAIAAVIARSKLDVPDSLMERQSVYIKAQEAADVKQRFNISMEDYLSKISVDQAKYEQTIRAKADASLRRTLVLGELGKKFGVEVKREELEAEISRLAALHGVERARIRAHYYKNEENMSQLSHALRYYKTSKLLLDNVKVKYVDKLSDETPISHESPADEVTEAIAAIAESTE